MDIPVKYQNFLPELRSMHGCNCYVIEETETGMDFFVGVVAWRSHDCVRLGNTVVCWVQ